MEKELNKIKFLLKLKNKLIFLFTSIFIVLFIFYFPIKNFNAFDPKPNIHYFKPIKGTELKGASPYNIKAGLFIKNFSKFDINNGSFRIDGIVWFKFNPQKVSSSLIDKFSFEKGTIISKKAETQIIGNKLLVKYYVDVEFKADLNYKFFPLEDHTIYLVLSNKNTTPSEFTYSSKSSNVSIAKDFKIDNWEPIDHNVENGYFVQEIDKFDTRKNSDYPIVLFAFNFSKKGNKLILLIFVTLFIMFFTSLTSLLIDLSSKGTMLTTAIGSVSSFVAMLFVLTNISPPVKYFTVSDKLYSIFFVFTFLILIFDIYINHFLKKKEKHLSIQNNKEKLYSRINTLRGFLFILFVILGTLSIYFILLRK